jgi:hypothetical protein
MSAKWNIASEETDPAGIGEIEAEVHTRFGGNLRVVAEIAVELLDCEIPSPVSSIET